MPMSASEVVNIVEREAFSKIGWTDPCDMDRVTALHCGGRSNSKGFLKQT